MQKEIYKPLKIWLIIGLVMVLLQVMIGGITRLTNSGLSITEWNIIKGTIPPLSNDAWVQTFEQYKIHAKKQYESLHAGMTMSEFKFIYFWEYFHRLWARFIGFVFVIGLVIFLLMRKIDMKLFIQLMIVFGLAMLEAVFGIIMVYSGLGDDTRTWVSAYKLIIHLIIATLIFGYLFYVYLCYTQKNTHDFGLSKNLKIISTSIIVLLFIQILFGGLMAGMRAGLIHPHFPIFIHSEKILGALQSPAPQSMDDLNDYEKSAYIKAIIQIIHRTLATTILILIAYLVYLFSKNNISAFLRRAKNSMLFMILIQITLGVITIMLSIGRIPPFWGSVHQCAALILLLSAIWVRYQMIEKK
jgi:cytochrome c oxidase assembly protein subunit 15